MQEKYITVEDKFLSLELRHKYNVIYTGYVKLVMDIFKRNKIDTTEIKKLFNPQFLSRGLFTMTDIKYTSKGSPTSRIETFHYIMKKDIIQLQDQLQNICIMEANYATQVYEKLKGIVTLYEFQKELKTRLNSLVLKQDAISLTIKYTHGYNKKSFLLDVLEKDILDKFMIFLSDILGFYSEILDKNIVLNNREISYQKKTKFYMLHGKCGNEYGFISRDDIHSITKNIDKAYIICADVDINNIIRNISGVNTISDIEAVDFTMDFNLATLQKIQNKKNSPFLEKIVAEKEKEVLLDSFEDKSSENKKEILDNIKKTINKI